MYPVVRLFKDMFVASRMPPIKSLTDLHVSHHICWPWDLDVWLELNNGRTLTLYDLGRMMLAVRGGLVGLLRREGWGLTVAGNTVRYRRRIRGMERFEMRSRVLCWDDRFIYIEQSVWKKSGECSSHGVLRTAVTDKDGIVAPARILAAMGQTEQSPAMPDWVARWAEAETLRPWPPMQDI